MTDNLIMVLFAGFETSTSLTVRLLYELAKHPEALQKVRQLLCFDDHQLQLSCMICMFVCAAAGELASTRRRSRWCDYLC